MFQLQHCQLNRLFSCDEMYSYRSAEISTLSVSQIQLFCAGPIDSLTQKREFVKQLTESFLSFYENFEFYFRTTFEVSWLNITAFQLDYEILKKCFRRGTNLNANRCRSNYRKMQGKCNFQKEKTHRLLFSI